jgi:cysteine-rich repeat protein
VGVLLSIGLFAFGWGMAAPAALDIGSDFRISDMGLDGDPAFSTFNPDAAYNSRDNQYLVVWSGNDGSGSMADNEEEVFGQLLDAEGNEIGTNDFRISNMGPDGSTGLYFGSTPAVAYNSEDNQYLVVWRGSDDRGALAEGESEIYGQLLEADGTEIGDDLRISDMGPDGDTFGFGAGDARVAYNSQDNEYLVVWSGSDDTGPLEPHELEIFGQRLRADGGETGDNDFRISDMGPDGNTNFVAVEPDVAYNSTDNRYLVVWRGEDDFNAVDDEAEIHGQLLEADGGETGDDFRISFMGPPNDVSFEAFNPAVTYNSTDNQFLVVWFGDDDTPPLVNNDREIFGQLLQADGDGVGFNFRISDMGPEGNPDFRASRPDVTYNSADNQYLVAWGGNDGSGSLADNETEAFGQLLNASGAETGDNDFRLSDAGNDGDPDAAVFFGAVAYNSVDNQYLAVWEADDGTSPLVDNEREVFGQLIAFPVCGNGVQEQAEACDDGNTDNGDGCSSSCQEEDGGGAETESGGGCAMTVSAPGAASWAAGLWLIVLFAPLIFAARAKRAGLRRREF